MASNYPAFIDNNTTLPPIVDGRPVTGNSVEVLRKAIIAIETELGVKPSGTYGTVKARLNALESSVSGFTQIVLGGDLDGTLTSQTVIGLQGRPVSSSSPTAGQFLGWSGIAWEPADNAPNIVYAGDLSGTLISQTVIGIQGKPISTTDPVTSQVLGWDGYFWTPTTLDFSAFIYQPGGSTGGNVFASWIDLMAARSASSHPAVIIIDDSIISPAVISVGVWDLTNNTKIVSNQFSTDGYDVASAKLDIPNGAQLLNPSEFENLSITGFAQTLNSISVDTPVVSPTANLILRNTQIYSDSTANISIIEGDFHTVQLYGNSSFFQSFSLNQVLENSTTYFTYLELFDLARVEQGTVSGKFAVYINGGGFCDSDQVFSIQTSLNQTNPIQTALYDEGDNPSLRVIRPRDFASNVSGEGDGQINFSTSTDSITYPGTNASYSTIIGGINHYAYGSYSTISGGGLNAVDAIGGTVAGGYNNRALGSYATISGGLDGYAFRVGQHAHAAGAFSAQGDAQFGRYFVKGTTTNGSGLALTDLTGSQFKLQNGKAYAITATCIANRVDGYARAMFVHTILAHATAGTVTIDNDNTTLSVPNGTAWTIVYSASTDHIVATFTGTVAQTVRAFITYEWSEVSGYDP